MTNAEQLEKSFETIEGFKKICKPFLFIFGGPKPSFAIWSKARVKKVVQNYSLAEFTHEDSHYQIMAFSIHGAMDEKTLEDLRKKAAGFPLGTVRYESTMQSSSDQLISLDFDDKDGSDILSLSNIDAGIFVYPRPTAEQSQQFPLVVYALHNGKHYYLPVQGKFLK